MIETITIEAGTGETVFVKVPDIEKITPVRQHANGTWEYSIHTTPRIVVPGGYRTKAEAEEDRRKMLACL